MSTNSQKGLVKFPMAQTGDATTTSASGIASSSWYYAGLASIMRPG